MTFEDNDDQSIPDGAVTGAALIDRILGRDQRAQALGVKDDVTNDFDGDQQDLADRAALRKVPGLSTQMQDISEVEYRERN